MMRMFKAIIVTMLMLFCLDAWAITTSTVTYYMNAYSSAASSWFFPEEGIDASEVTKAQWIGPPAAPAGAWYYMSANSCAGVDLGQITAVEFRVLYQMSYGSGGTFQFKMQPEFNGSSLGTLRTIGQNTNVVPATWSGWYNITSDPNAPTWGHNWSTVSGIDMNCYGYGQNPDTIYVHKVELRVTYIPKAVMAAILN